MDTKAYNALVVVTPQDYSRVKSNRIRQISNLPVRRVIYIGNEEVGRLLYEEFPEESPLRQHIEFINENDILSFDDVHSVMTDIMAPMLNGAALPRGITGWYYQQFLKMQYSRICDDDYYLVWDGDTVACDSFSMFSSDMDIPYLDIKQEYHEEYFTTIGRILPGMRKVIGPSFVSEHMLMKSSLMQELITAIESNASIPGEAYWEKVLRSIPIEKIQDSAFSEFETYGTYIALRHPMEYRIRDWRSFRLAGEFFDPETISDTDYKWLSRSFQAISFEKGHFVREDHKNLFDNPYYQERLTAGQMLEVVQEEFQDGYKEVWVDPAADAASQKALNDEKHKHIVDAVAALKSHDGDRMLAEIRAGLGIDINDYSLYVLLAQYYSEFRHNNKQAWLCYEHADWLCDTEEKQGIKKLQDDLRGEIEGDGENVPAPVSIVIVSWNNMKITEDCIRSIRRNAPQSAYEIVVVDNASTDGIVQWLENQIDIRLIRNETNVGFGAGCNQGAALSSEGYDIFFLNNDTLITQAAILNLRLALAEGVNIGAVGCCTNYKGSHQTVDNMPGEGLAVSEYLGFARKNNIPVIPVETAYIERPWLSGFAVAIKRDVWNELDGFDGIYGMGYFEDNDLCEQIKRLGLHLVMCRNSYIFHYGSKSFGLDVDAAHEMILKNREAFINKWGFDPYDEA